MKTATIILSTLALTCTSTAFANDMKAPPENGGAHVGGYAASNGDSGLAIGGNSQVKIYSPKIHEDDKGRTTFIPILDAKMGLGVEAPTSSQGKIKIESGGNFSFLGHRTVSDKVDTDLRVLPLGLKMNWDDRLRNGAMGFNVSAAEVSHKQLLKGILSGCLNARVLDLTLGSVQIQDTKSGFILEPLAAGACLEADLGEKYGKLKLGGKVSFAATANHTTTDTLPFVATASAGLGYSKKVGDTMMLGAGIESSVGYSRSAMDSDPNQKTDSTVTVNKAVVELAF